MTLLALVLLFAACGGPGQSGDETEGPGAQPGQQAGESTDAAPPEDEAGTSREAASASPEQNAGTENGEPGSAADRDQTEAGQGHDTPSEPEAPAEPQYYMNKNFFIKPMDEDADNKIVLLTFDDGPKEEGLLAQILDTLDKHEAKAIFFVNGFRVKQNPELLRLIHERGHMIGNHSWDHINLREEPAEVVAKQIGDVQAIVEELTGEAPKFFRPPHGSGSDTVRAVVKEHGMLYMTWSNGSLDWDDNRNNPDGVVETVLKQLLPGSNILMHELEWTAAALDPLLTEIRERGYRFVDPRLIALEAR